MTLLPLHPRTFSTRTHCVSLFPALPTYACQCLMQRPGDQPDATMPVLTLFNGTALSYSVEGYPDTQPPPLTEVTEPTDACKFKVEHILGDTGGDPLLVVYTRIIIVWFGYAASRPDLYEYVLIIKGHTSRVFLNYRLTVRIGRMYMLGYTWVKIEWTESRETAILANRSSEPTKFLSCESRSALITKERLAIWCPC